MYDSKMGQFLSEDPIEFYALDPNLRRYVHNSPTDLMDPTGLAEEDATLVVGFIPLTKANGKTYQIQIISVANGMVTIKYKYVGLDGKAAEGTATVDITEFGKEDQALLNNLQKVPPNVTIDPSSVSNEKDKGKSFVADVAQGIANIDSTKTGKPIIDGIKKAGKPPSRSKETRIIIVDTDRELRDKSPVSFIENAFNPNNSQLVQTTSPKVHYNRKSGHAVLGKELWHGWQQLEGAVVPNPTKWDSDAGPMIRDPLITELKELE